MIIDTAGSLLEERRTPRQISGTSEPTRAGSLAIAPVTQTAN
jgi:hypothetical protein